MEAAERARHSVAREALCAAVEGAEGDAVPGVVEQTRTAWAALEPLAGAEGDLLGRRFEAALAAAEERHAAFLGAAARESQLLALCAQAEELTVSEDRWPAGRGRSARQGH